MSRLWFIWPMWFFLCRRRINSFFIHLRDISHAKNCDPFVHHIRNPPLHKRNHNKEIPIYCLFEFISRIRVKFQLFRLEATYALEKKMPANDQTLWTVVCIQALIELNIDVMWLQNWSHFQKMQFHFLLASITRAAH